MKASILHDGAYIGEDKYDSIRIERGKHNGVYVVNSLLSRQKFSKLYDWIRIRMKVSSKKSRTRMLNGQLKERQRNY